MAALFDEDAVPANVAGGFDFGNFRRNEHLLSSGMKAPKATSTGTTIVGLMYSDGIILGADTRATEGPIVADKNCSKIHYIASNMYCCGAGTAADTEMTTNLISSKMELHRLNSGRQVKVVAAMQAMKQMLFKYHGQIGAALILGGIDIDGYHLFTIHPHGSVDKLPFVTMGSGSLAAMAIMESQWKPNMTKEEGITVVHNAIEAGIFNDLGSGSNTDITVISKTEGVQVLRNYKISASRVGPVKGSYKYPRGTTSWLKEDIRKYVTIEETSKTADAMDVS